MTKILSFSLYYWQYPLLMSIGLFFQTFTGSRLKPSSLIFIPILNSFSHLFAIVQEDLFICFFKPNRMRSTKVKQQDKSIKIADNLNKFKHRSQMHKKNKKKTKSQETMRYCLVLIALGFVNSFSHSIFISYTSFKSVGFTTIQAFFEIILTSLLCFLLLNTRLFRQHFFAISIFALDIIMYFSIRWNDFTQYVTTHYDWGTFFLLFMLYSIPTSFREVIEKYIMEKYFYSAPMILFSESVFSLSVFILYFIGIQSTSCNKLGYFETLCNKSKWHLFVLDVIDYFDYTSLNCLVVWGYLISTYFASLFRVQTIEHLSPTHRFVGEMLYHLYWFINNVIVNSINKIEGSTHNYVMILDFVQVVLVLFSSCVFNEYIIIRLCKLHHNTHLEISRRAADEVIMLDQLDSIELRINPLIEGYSNNSKNNKVY